MLFHKYHALGNDYLVVDPAEALAGGIEGAIHLTPDRIRLICDRHYGAGSDGLLLGPLPAADADFGLRLFNPDGGEFEKSGNGLRIFARYLWDIGRVSSDPFTILTPGGRVTARVHAGARQVSIDMGRVSFDSQRIPVLGPSRDVLDEEMIVDGHALRYSAATIGNPHCVLVWPAPSAEEARQWGPLIEHDPHFPKRTNVQFMHVLDRANIRIEIWERGAGYTLASGSSSCAAAAVAHRLGLTGADVGVHMPGGTLHISIRSDWSVTMTGAVTRVCDGRLHDELFDARPA